MIQRAGGGWVACYHRRGNVGSVEVGPVMADPVNKVPTILDAARRVAPLIQRAAGEIEHDRRLTPEVVDALHDAGLYRMLLPRWLGGAELDLPTFGAVIEEIAKADASTAWCLCQTSGCSLVAGFLDREVADELFGQNPRSVLAWGPGSGRATVVDGGYRLTGSWSFASGAHHSTWLGGFASIFQADGTPRLGPGGSPEKATLIFPTGDATFIDTWQVSGLLGTGSDTFAVEDLFVPSRRIVRRDDQSLRREPGPLYRFPSNQIFATGFSSVALGIARTVVDAFIELARTKTPYGLAGPLRENAVVQSQIAQAEAQVRAGRAYRNQTVADVWEAVSRTGELTLGQRVAVRLAATHAIHLAAQAVDLSYHLAGSSAILTANPFERRFRDIHAVTQQVQGRYAHYENAGRFLFGLEVGETWL